VPSLNASSAPQPEPMVMPAMACASGVAGCQPESWIASVVAI
jgi:hypothetical protein